MGTCRTQGSKGWRSLGAFVLAMAWVVPLGAQEPPAATRAPEADDPAPQRPPDPDFAAWHKSLPKHLPGHAHELSEQLEECFKTQPRFYSASRRKASIAAKDRAKILPATIQLGLAWLAAHQSPEGHWSCSSFDEECGTLGQDTYCKGRGSPIHDVGVTGLALLAFLRAGEGGSDAYYEHTVRRGLDWLVWEQHADGTLGVPEARLHTYDHMVATLALCEALAGPRGERYRPAAEKALDVVAALQTPGAGWRYADPTSVEMLAHPSDVSATAWALQALVAARDAGLSFDPDMLEQGLHFIEEMTDASGRTGYYERGGQSARLPGTELTWPQHKTAAMTAAGMLCRRLLDPALQRPGNEDALSGGTELLVDLPPVWDTKPEDVGRVDYYYFYYGTLALAGRGRKAWDTWRNALIETVIAHGVEDDDRIGSWEPSRAPWGKDGGRVYATAIMTLACIAADI